MARTPTGYVSESQAAEILGLSPKTLERYRWQDCGPPARRYRGRVLYKLDELQEWLEREARPWQDARRERLEATR